MSQSDLNSEQGEYNPIVAYGQSKLANVYFANEIERRYGSHNLHALSLHPGGIITPLARYIGSTKAIEEHPEISKILKNPSQGAATSVWAATAKELDGKGGLYLGDVAVAEQSASDTPETYHLPGHSAYAFDPAAESKLWTESLKLVGLSA